MGRAERRASCGLNPARVGIHLCPWLLQLESGSLPALGCFSFSVCYRLNRLHRPPPPPPWPRPPWPPPPSTGASQWPSRPVISHLDPPISHLDRPSPISIRPSPISIRHLPSPAISHLPPSPISRDLSLDPPISHIDPPSPISRHLPSTAFSHLPRSSTRSAHLPYLSAISNLPLSPISRHLPSPTISHLPPSHLPPSPPSPCRARRASPAAPPCLSPETYRVISAGWLRPRHLPGVVWFSPFASIALRGRISYFGSVIYRIAYIGHMSTLEYM